MKYKYEQTSIIVVTFNDGETLESNGSSSGIEDPELRDDLTWIYYTLPGYIRDRGKTMSDVKKIEIKLEYYTE